MATPANSMPPNYTNAGSTSHEDEPPAKRPKTQACVRCRRRKQKCDGQRPCSNCNRSSERCQEAPSASYPRPVFAPQLQDSSYHTPLAWLGDIASLEERISRIEQENRASAATSNLRVHAVEANHNEQLPQRRCSHALQSGTDGSLARSSPAIGLLATFARSEVVNTSLAGARDSDSSSRPLNQPDPEGTLDRHTQEALFEIYHDKVHCRYPFLRLEQFRDPDMRADQHWVAYFVHMILSIGLLLEKNGPLDPSQHSLQQTFYRKAVTQYLSHVFAQPDRLLHIQAYLLLAMHAIYSPSSERIISIASATMRYCVMAQLHLADAEPDPVDVPAKVEVQMRRRVFWSAYTLDRTVGTMFDLPFSIPDYQITAKMYANIDDHELEERCAESFPGDPPSRPRLTNVSAALHVVYCRQIQSEILNTTLHRDFGKQFDRLSNWRLRVLEKLDHWKSLCHRYSDTRSKTFTSSEWLHMIYNYSLAMLYQPTKTTVAGPAGDWTVKSCVQACLIFRKFQRETPITELWLGLIAQFKCGVALLYCFFATPPHLRSPAYESTEASEAVRACSIILSILAERWPQSKCLRDAFDILAREITLFEPSHAPAASPRRMRQDSADTLLTLLKQLETIVVHRNTLRMIKEMAIDEFPRLPAERREDVAEDGAAPEQKTPGVEERSPSWRTGMTGDIFEPITPYFFQRDLDDLDPEGFNFTTLGFPGEFDPEPSFRDI